MATLSRTLNVFSDGSVKPTDLELRRMAAINQGSQGDTNQRPPYIGTAKFGGGYSFTDAGADWPITLGEAEKALIYRVNPPSDGYTTEQKIQWAVHESVGYLYQGTIEGVWKWPFIVMASRVGYPEQVNVLAIEKYYGSWAEISLLPRMKDYSSITPEAYPGWFAQVYAGSHLTPKGHFCMPLFDPWNFVHPRPDDAEIDGVFVPVGYFA